MNKNPGIIFLIFCFSLSNVSAGLATQVMQISPIVVQPVDLQELDQQMLAQDRINRDQELAIKGLIDDNQRLADTAFARKQYATLDKIDQTMDNYRDSLLARDRARIAANSQGISKYHDLIVLTENIDDMRGVGQALQEKSDVIDEKYKILTQLKDEMLALNEKLKNDEINRNADAISEQQEEKIQMLTQKLGEMDQRIAQYDEILAEKDRQIVQLKDSLAQAQNESAAKDETIKQQQDQITVLRNAPKGIAALSANQMELSPIIVDTASSEPQAAPQVIQAAPVVVTPIQIKDQNAYADLQAEIVSLKNKIQQQSLEPKPQEVPEQHADQEIALKIQIRQQENDLKASAESIRWLNQIVAVLKNKAKYYQITSWQDRVAIKDIQARVEWLKDDFIQRSKHYDQFANTIVALKDQVSRLGMQLSQKEEQSGLLRTALEDKAAQDKVLNLENAQIRENLKAQLWDKEKEILKMKADLLAILDTQANKEIYLRKATAQVDDRVKLAKQLIDLQQQEAALLDEKSDLEAAQNKIFDKHALALEHKVNELLVSYQAQVADLHSRVQGLQDALNLKQQQAESVENGLENRISDLKAKISSGQATQSQVDVLKQQLADGQDQLALLKQELDNKSAQSDQMTSMIAAYQKKLESKNNAYNQQLRQVLDFKNDQAQMQAQIAGLNTVLQQKEAQLVNVKKAMYDLQQLTNAKDVDIQTKDLNLSMIQQKIMDEKTAELAVARQQLGNVPSSDELEFLRMGLSKATTELKQKDGELLRVKANADEYDREFKEQTQEFLGLKDQLRNAQQELGLKNEDLKYKDLALIRLKERSFARENDLQSQVKVLTQKLNVVEKRLMAKTHENKVDVLQAQLKKADLQIKGLQAELSRLTGSAKYDPAQEKLDQAMTKIDQQGQIINALVQKLQDAGKSVDLTEISVK